MSKCILFRSLALAKSLFRRSIELDNFKLRDLSLFLEHFLEFELEQLLVEGEVKDDIGDVDDIDEHDDIGEALVELVSECVDLAMSNKFFKLAMLFRVVA